jgi:molybdopterin molybdotransferase
MLTVDEALKLVLDRTRPLGSQRVEADHALGLLLAEPIASDVDSPPHDKAIVDGYAVVASDAALPGAELTVLEEVTAGAVPSRLVEPGTATRIMTGAPLPRGADAIVMVEQTNLVAPERVRLLAAVKVGQNIMRRGASLTSGQMVLEPGKQIRAIEAGLLAEVGRSHVLVNKWPSVGVLATGNELVDRCEQPGAGQIRNSNGPLLKALATQAGADAYEAMGPARDNVEDLARCLKPGLNHDVLLVSGGVSAGVLDLVPQVLAELGVEQVFHKVNLKPGKPLWFGVKHHTHNDRQTLVFGLPGNPVSTLVCFELFVRPAIERLSGREPKGLARVAATLTQDHQQRGERPTYWPARLDEHANQRQVTPLPWQGSGDLRTLTDANGLAFFSAGERTFRRGETVQVLVFA